MNWLCIMKYEEKIYNNIVMIENIACELYKKYNIA